MFEEFIIPNSFTTDMLPGFTPLVVLLSVLGILNTPKDSVLLILFHWRDARAVWYFRIHEQVKSTRLKIYFLCDGYLIPCKPYPKRLPLSMLLPVLVLGRAALANS